MHKVGRICHKRFIYKAKHMLKSPRLKRDRVDIFVQSLLYFYIMYSGLFRFLFPEC